MLGNCQAKSCPLPGKLEVGAYSCGDSNGTGKNQHGQRVWSILPLLCQISARLRPDDPLSTLVGPQRHMLKQTEITHTTHLRTSYVPVVAVFSCTYIHYEREQPTAKQAKERHAGVAAGIRGLNVVCTRGGWLNCHQPNLHLVPQDL